MGVVCVITGHARGTARKELVPELIWSHFGPSPGIGRVKRLCKLGLSEHWIIHSSSDYSKTRFHTSGKHRFSPALAPCYASEIRIILTVIRVRIDTRSPSEGPQFPDLTEILLI